VGAADDFEALVGEIGRSKLQHGCHIRAGSRGLRRSCGQLDQSSLLGARMWPYSTMHPLCTDVATR
jgi:hypothetical protein